MPVTVRNNQNTIVVFSHPTDKSLAVEWKAKGDPLGEDIQQVPDSMVESTPFLRAVGLGILSVDTDSQALADAIARQSARYRGQQQAEQSELDGILDTASQSGVIRITENQLDAHIERLSKSQPSDLSTIGETIS